MGVSILSSAGLPELIVTSTEEYKERLVDLACDLPRLATLRSTMRRRLLDSPLTAATVFNRELETVYRQLWQRWCAGVGKGE
jgi:predicted O-linked N-acetylglucosamine transferase (SPINDLY family)